MPSKRTKSKCAGQRIKCSSISGCKLTKSTSKKNSYCRLSSKTRRKGLHKRFSN